MRNLWYKNAIAYSLDVESFMDSNGDGIGDFQGLIQRLDYLASLGINCLWLLPFYPSPNCDNGYDVMDYYNIDPRHGTLGDFVEFMHQAHERGIRVVVDLVVNHTSKQHPWFQAARRDKNSQYYDYYIWSKEKPEIQESKPAFPDVVDTIWTYDEEVDAYYLHHFYPHQPDLNIANPAVREEIRKIMGFWLELGVSGFRIDAAPYLINPIGVKGVAPEDLEDTLTDMREFLNERQAGAILLAEANVDPEQIPIYFGNGDRMQMLFNFLLNQYMFLALARQDAPTLREGLELLPDIPATGQWFNFVRHHDELTLDRISEDKQQEIFRVFAPDENMQIYGHGVRRRLPPMLQNDRRRIELVYSMLFSLPGTPVIRYGEEIGMGDDLSLEGRDSVRTVMQWSNSHSGGFSTASKDKLAKPLIAGGEYGYERVNVVDQQRDRNSLLNWIEQAIRIRQQCPEFGEGKWQILETDNNSVFAHACQYKGSKVIAVHNLSARPCSTTLKTEGQKLKDWIEVFSDKQYKPLEGDSASILLEGYGYRWFRANKFPEGC